VLGATGAVKLVVALTPEERQLENVVEEVAIAAGVPRPKIWIVPDPDPNAFATGLTPERAHLAVTRGLLTTLKRDELQGVVAHEMAHIRNLDVRLMTLLAAMVGTIALMSDTLQRFWRMGGRVTVGGGGREGKKGGNPLAILVLVLWLVSLVLAPLVSRFLAMTVSRGREYLADATAAQFTRNPMALASALEMIAASTGATRSIARGAAHMCIIDPAERRISSRPGLLGDVFASHPPIRERIARLRAMAYEK
jgi:heat shock protein HtpX